MLSGVVHMFRKRIAIYCLLLTCSTAHAATLFTISGIMDPDWDIDYFNVPQFTYNVPLEVKFKLSRPLQSGEQFKITSHTSVEWDLYANGDMINYDYYMFSQVERITTAAYGSFPYMNYHEHNQWYEYYDDETLRIDEHWWATLQQLELESTVFAPFEWTITISGAVPEPASWGLMIAGFGLAGLALRQRRAIQGV